MTVLCRESDNRTLENNDTATRNPGPDLESTLQVLVLYCSSTKWLLSLRQTCH